MKPYIMLQLRTLHTVLEMGVYADTTGWRDTVTMTQSPRKWEVCPFCWVFKLAGFLCPRCGEMPR